MKLIFKKYVLDWLLASIIGISVEKAKHNREKRVWAQHKGD